MAYTKRVIPSNSYIGVSKIALFSFNSLNLNT